MKKQNNFWCKCGEVTQNYQFMGQVSKVFPNIWFKQVLTEKINKFFIYFHNDIGSIYFLRNEINNNSSFLTDKVIGDPEWGLKFLKRIEKKHEEYFENTESIRSVNLIKASDHKLLNLLKSAEVLNVMGHEVTRGIIWQLDQDNERLLQEIERILQQKNIEKNQNFKIKIILPELTTPLKDTIIFKEQVNLLNIGKIIVKNENLKNIFVNNIDHKKILELLAQADKKLYDLIYDHYRNYRWLSYLYQEPANSIKYYIKRLKDLALDEDSVGKIIARYREGKKKTQDVREIIINELGLSGKELKLIEFARELSFIKDYRKAVIAHGTFCLKKLFKEISKRLNIPINLIRMMDSREVVSALKYHEYDIEELNQRVDEALYYYSRDHQNKILSGENASKFYSQQNIYQKSSSEKKVLQGAVASSGVVRGIARIIIDKSDIDKMHQGEIAVTKISDTSPVPAIANASGIITECGGLTCHAAIYAREINVPCLVGVEDATKLIKDGEMIELDADNGVVYKI